MSSLGSSSSSSSSSASSSSSSTTITPSSSSSSNSSSYSSSSSSSSSSWSYHGNTGGTPPPLPATPSSASNTAGTPPPPPNTEGAPTSSPSSAGISAGAIPILTTSLVVGGLVLIVITIFIIKCIRKIKMQKTTSDYVEEAPLNAIIIGNPKISIINDQDPKMEMPSIQRFLGDFPKQNLMRFTPEQLIDFTGNYTIKLGSGGFGEVYKGQLSNGLLIAVKVLNETIDTKAEEFIAKVGALGRADHINLVKLYGFCFEDKLKALVYEFMDNGSLDQTVKIEWKKLYGIAVGVAKGIRYLNEESDNKIIHFDIKPGNILLNQNFFPKVADFGLAEIFYQETTVATILGSKRTSGFVAPELRNPITVTDKCDVYSFGMLLFEMLWSTWNLEFVQAESKERFPRWVWEKVDHKELESVILHCGDGEDRMKAERMCKVALWCVQHEPEKRPSMSKVVKMLEGQQEIDAPVNPCNSMVLSSYADEKSTD